jgi:hypothetical protein
MSDPIYRPPSVWITQVLLGVQLFSLIAALVVSSVQCALQLDPNCSLPNRLTWFASGSLAVALLFLTLWGLQTRTLYGKWLAAALLLLGMITVIAQSHSFQLIARSITQWQPLPAPPYECWENEHLSLIQRSCGYSSYPGFVVNIISDGLPAGLLGLLAMRLLYGDAAKRFFR